MLCMYVCMYAPTDASAAQGTWHVSELWDSGLLLRARVSAKKARKTHATP